MPSWVVPAVAAEYWGVTPDSIWSQIYNQQIPHRTEAGFVFVNVDGNSPDPLPRRPAPPTFVCAADLEETWSQIQTFCLVEEDDSQEEDEDDLADLDETELPDLDSEEEATFGRLSWQETRDRVSRTRRPPAGQQLLS